MHPTQYEQFLQAIDELEASPGARILREIQELQRSFRILGRTYADLNDVLGKLENLDDPWLLWAQGNEKNMDEAIIWVAARLQGFLAAAASLVDHARAHGSRLYSGSDFNDVIRDELQSRVLNRPHQRLAKGFRNYLLHVATAPIVGSLSLTRKDGDANEFDSDSSFRLSRDELLAWSKWTREERKALGLFPEDIPIREFVREYYSQVSGFYEWLWARQQEVHATELAETDAIRIRAKALYGER